MFKFIVIFVVLVLFFLSPFFIKVKTECRTQYGECPFELESGNLYQTKRKITKNLKNNYLVTDFSMQFKLPNILLVNVLVKKPIFAIQDVSNKIFLIDKDGKILSTVDSTSLPMVVQESSIPNLFTLNLMQGISQMYQINIGRIENDSLVVELPTSIKVIFPLSGDSQVLLGSLRLVYPKIGTYREIDLRFKNPVLR